MMVDVTYQMVLSTIQTLGLLVGIFYYITTLRNAQQMRKTQTAGQIAERRQSKELSLIALDLMDMEWKNYEDYLTKYGSTVNKENYAKRAQIFGMFDGAGYMLKKGMIDVETTYNLGNPQGTILLWEKFKSVIMNHRKRFNDPHHYRWFEYYVNELMKERIRQGLSPLVSDMNGVLDTIA